MNSQFNLFVKDNVRALRLWHVWAYLAWQDVISKYRRSILGPLWIAGGMVSTSLAISISLGAMSGQPLREFLPFAMAGILVWTHFVGILISEAPEIFVGAQGAIKNNAFPFMFYVFRFVTKSLIIFLHNLVVLFIVMLSVRKLQVPTWEVVPAVALLTAFMLFATPVVGMASARFRDLRFLLPYTAQILFFITPVFWRPATLSASKINIVKYNPLYYLVDILRAPLLGESVVANAWLISLLSLLVVFIVWAISFTVFRRRIAFWI